MAPGSWIALIVRFWRTSRKTHDFRLGTRREGGPDFHPCWRRIQKLEESGVIQKRVTLFNPKSLNLGVTVFIAVRTNEHRFGWFEEFHKVVSAIPEVVDFYRVAGSTDYLIKVAVSDIEGYDGIYKTLIKGADLADVTSMFVIEEIKHTTALPLTHA